MELESFGKLRATSLLEMLANLLRLPVRINECKCGVHRAFHFVDLVCWTKTESCFGVFKSEVANTAPFAFPPKIHGAFLKRAVGVPFAPEGLA